MISASSVAPIIVVEDNLRDREYLLLSLGGMEFEITDRGDLALEMFKAKPESYIISDLQLPGINGVELASEVCNLVPTARIVIWSQYNDEIYLRTLGQIIPAEALYGYVLKNNPTKILNRAVNSVFTDEQCWIDPQIRPVQARYQPRESGITNAEYEVLADIALGMTDQLIAKRRFLSKRGVQSRLKSLYEKLGIDRSSSNDGINPRSRAVALALTRGLLNKHELDRAEIRFSEWRRNNT